MKRSRLVSLNPCNLSAAILHPYPMNPFLHLVPSAYSFREQEIRVFSMVEIVVIKIGKIPNF